MQTRLTIQAPAKINLHLEIHQRRSDGFHDLRSIFQQISLADTIDIRIETAAVFSCRVSGTIGIAESENSMYRAASKFYEALGTGAALQIACTKRIPMQAGLGGGSSDAAAVLKALNEVEGNPMSLKELSAIGAAIGSDVPFFLHGPAALVSGRGEVVEPITARGDLSGLLLIPPFGISTPEAFRDLDTYRVRNRPKNTEIQSIEELVRQYQAPVASWRFSNDFTPVLYEAYPDYHCMSEILMDAGFPFLTISGSGSSMIGITDTSTAVTEGMTILPKLSNMQVRPIKMLDVTHKAVYN
ncbi:MAG: 4-(cytidine 5'-diphospho)-2-C-methyl-D-erythritol kinase [Spirochaetia bacterium]|nr:4-(cytidine 5'-diphospho)-2-C-methyl-D-erythritol kinase [Spirochaetia bacterium]MCF7940804.1 4-(cytidine 5'-diphospho)-2-C-methyl-D-erythritol kinase [Spirochaetia bacterium]